MLKPVQSCPIFVTVDTDKDTSAILFAHEDGGGVDVIDNLCTRCLNAVQRLQDMKRWMNGHLGWTENFERGRHMFGCIACLYDLEHSTFRVAADNLTMSDSSRRPTQTAQSDRFRPTAWPRPTVEHEMSEVDGMLGEDSSCCRLTQLAIIATGPRSPLLYTPVATRVHVNLSSPLLDMHTYSRRPDKEPPAVIQRTTSLKLPEDDTYHLGYKQQGEEPCLTQGHVAVNTDTHQWPAVVWQCFMKGTSVRFGGQGHMIWQLVDDVAQHERLGTRTSHLRYAPNGLKLLNVGEQNSRRMSVEDKIGSSVLVFSPEVRGQPQLRARCIMGHPFFVKGKGWCSLHPDITARHYGMWCSELELEDWCLPPTHPDAVVTHPALDTFKSYDLTPMDSTAVITLCNMARKRSLSQSDTVTSLEEKKKADCALVHRAKRPMNAFMLFAKKCRMEFTRMYPGRDNREISVLLGNTWQKMKLEERKMYALEARELAEQYKKLNPDCWKRKRAASWSVGS